MKTNIIVVVTKRFTLALLTPERLLGVIIVFAVCMNTLAQEVMHNNLISEYFAEDSLVGDVTTVPCTLSSGTEAECYQFTV